VYKSAAPWEKCHTSLHVKKPSEIPVLSQDSWQNHHDTTCPVLVATIQTAQEEKLNYKVEKSFTLNYWDTRLK